MNKNRFVFLLLLLFFFSLYPKINTKSFLHLELNENSKNITKNSTNDLLLENAIYIIRNKEGNQNLDIENKLPYFVDYPKKNLKKHFRVIVIDKKTRKQTYTINSDNLYCLEDKDNNKRIGVTNEKGDVGLFDKPKNKSDIFGNDKIIWNLIPKLFEEKDGNVTYQRRYFYLKNVATGKYLRYQKKGSKGIFVCDSNNIEKFTKDNYFIFNKMYREQLPDESLEIIEKEPIDVFIKYIDLTDPNLKREGIKQIPKDQDNQELKYSIRSILKYIPWVRKIFILMPNERVRYFKPPEEIKDKIVYVKDKDLLGFDSAASRVFQYHLWKMKQFGMSENFIMMDDDYFIGRPLKKSNFFYEENGKVYPGLVTRDYYELSKKGLHKILDPLLKKIETIHPHSPNGFTVVQKKSLLFLYDIFGDDSARYGQPIIEPSFTHNAIPVCQSDIKEIYDYIEKLYPYKNSCLLAKEREIYALQPQTLFLAYPRIKYDRRVKMISSLFYDLTQFKGVVKSDLFVINTSNKNYAKSYFKDEIRNLEKLYPEKTPYELDEKDINNKKSDTNKDTDSDKNNEKDKNNNKNDDKDKNNNKNDDKDKNKNEKDDNKRNNNKDDKEKNKDDDDNYNYKRIMNYLEKKFLEKKQLKNDLTKINDKIKELNEKYDKMEKQIEELSKPFNGTSKKNITLNEIENDKSQKVSIFKFVYLLIIILIFIGVIYFLIKNQYFSKGSINNNSEVNYFDINSLNGVSSENEMSLMNSKIEI